jgi:DNA-binding transcriptional MocR family regulator
MLAAAMRKATSAGRSPLTALQYGDPAGEARLRDALALKLADHGIAAHAGADRHHGRRDAMPSTSSPAPCCAPATACSSTSPGWSVEYARLAALGMRVLPVPRGSDGPTSRRCAA